MTRHDTLPHASADAVTRLAAHRPTSDDLEAGWPAAARSAVLEDALHRPDRTGRPARRPLRIAAAAAVVAVGIGGTSILWPRAGVPSAAALDALAATAARASTIPSGQYLHLITRSSQSDEGRATEQRTIESWTDAAGRVWRHDRSSTTPEMWFAFCPPRRLADSYAGATAEQLATLPTDPVALEEHLRATVTGSTSPDEAVFVAVGDMLRGEAAPPALRSAALQVLGRTPHVTTSETTRDGRPVVEVTFRDDDRRRGVAQTEVFDTATASIVAERITADAGAHVYTSNTQNLGLTDALPQEVRTRAVTQCDGAPEVKN